MTLLPGDIPSAADDWSRVRGAEVVLKGRRITNAGNPVATTSGTTELNLPLYALEDLTLEDGRYYAVKCLVTFTKTVGGDDFDLRLRSNTAVSGTLVTATATDFTDDRTIGHRVSEMLVLGDSTITDLYLSVIRTSGSGTLSYYSQNNGSRAWIALLDLGDNWADVS